MRDICRGTEHLTTHKFLYYSARGLNQSLQHLDEYPLEQVVTQQIGDMPFLWLAMPDRVERGLVERNTIGPYLACRSLF